MCVNNALCQYLSVNAASKVFQGPMVLSSSSPAFLKVCQSSLDSGCCFIHVQSSSYTSHLYLTIYCSLEPYHKSGG